LSVRRRRKNNKSVIKKVSNPAGFFIKQKHGYHPVSGKGSTMSEFKIIETQEEFDARISERLKRDRESFAKKYEGWTSPEDLTKIQEEHEQAIKALQDSAAETEKKLAEKDAEIAEGVKYRTDLEKTRIALAAGLKIDYADRLRGENAEEWKADAEALAKDFAASHITAPIGSNEPKATKESQERAAWNAMLSDLENNQ